MQWIDAHSFNASRCYRRMDKISFQLHIKDKAGSTLFRFDYAESCGGYTPLIENLSSCSNIHQKHRHSGVKTKIYQLKAIASKARLQKALKRRGYSVLSHQQQWETYHYCCGVFGSSVCTKKGPRDPIRSYHLTARTFASASFWTSMIDHWHRWSLEGSWRYQG